MYTLFLHVSSSLIIRNQPLWPGYCLDLISREFQESDNIKSSSLICEGSFLPRSVIHLPSKSHLLIVLHSHCSSSCINSILLVGIWMWQTLLYFCLLIYSLTHSFILCWVDACMLSRVWLFVTPLTVAHQAPLSMGFSKARILAWVAISYSRASSWPKDWACVSCICGQILYCWATWKA